MNAVTNGAFWDNETDVTHRKGATITATPVRIAFLKHIGLVDSITGTSEELTAYYVELDRLNGISPGDAPTLNNSETFSI